MDQVDQYIEQLQKKDGDWTVRMRAAWALGELGDARATEPLIAALKDEEWEVCRRCRAEIKNIGYRNAWVARVILRVREAPEYELQEEPMLPDATTDSLIAPTDSTDRDNGSDNR